MKGGFYGACRGVKFIIIELRFDEFRVTTGSIETSFELIGGADRAKVGFYGACRGVKFRVIELDYHDFNVTTGSIETYFDSIRTSNQ